MIIKVRSTKYKVQSEGKRGEAPANIELDLGEVFSLPTLSLYFVLCTLYFTWGV